MRNIVKQIQLILNGIIEVPNPDPDKPHRARLLNMLLLGMFVLTGLAIIAVLAIQLSGGYSFSEGLETYIPASILLLFIVGLHRLNSHHSNPLAAWLFLTLLLLIFYMADSPIENVWGRNMIVLAIPILMASVILPPTSSFVMVGILSLLFLFANYSADVGFNIIGITTYFAFALVSWLASNTLEKTLENLREAKEEAEKATRIKSEFLANMSHEIRTPLNGILGMAQVMQGTDLSEEQKDSIETINNSGETLLALINQILDFSKIESGHLELEAIDFDLRKQIENTIKILNGRAKEKAIEFACEMGNDIPAYFIGDPTRLKQVFINLIGNAIKFTKYGEISVRAELIEKDENQARLKFLIKDTGIGIPRDRIQSLFTPFTQADSSTTRRYGGTGLGLSICRQIVEAMGGEVWVESEVGVGSTFYFTAVLQLSSLSVAHKQLFVPSVTVSLNKETNQDKLSNSTNQHEDERSLKILLADDNKINLKVANRMLERLGYQADQVENGAEALEAVAQKRYDVILMDIQMPKMDGVQATKQIIQKYGEEHPRIIAMTANAIDGDREYFLSQGMDDYISKPVSMEKLKEVLNKVEQLPLII